MECSTNETALIQVSEIELVYRSKVKASCRPAIKCPKDSYEIFLQYWDPDKVEMVEQFKVLLLNRANKVLGIYEVSTGGMVGTTVDSRLIFVAALKAAACSVVLAHNHPSGSLRPSRADELLTQQIKKAGVILDIAVLDHLIISGEGYLSFAEEGLL